MTNKPVFTDVPQYFRTKISRRPLFGILRPSSTQLRTGPCKLSTMRRMASWWGRSTAREGLGTEQPAPGTTLSRTCEAKAPGITRARSGGAGAATPAQTPRSLVGGNLLGPATARMTDALVPRAQRVCDSARFIRLDYTIGKQLGAPRARQPPSRLHRARHRMSRSGLGCRVGQKGYRVLAAVDVAVCCS